MDRSVRNIYDTLSREIDVKDDVPLLTPDFFTTFLDKAIRITISETKAYWALFTKQGRKNILRYELPLTCYDVSHAYYGNKKLTPIFGADYDFWDDSIEPGIPKYWSMVWKENKPFLLISPKPSEDKIIKIFFKRLPLTKLTVDSVIPLPMFLWGLCELLVNYYVGKVYNLKDYKICLAQYEEKKEEINEDYADIDPLVGKKGVFIFYDTE